MFNSVTNRNNIKYYSSIPDCIIKKLEIVNNVSEKFKVKDINKILNDIGKNYNKTEGVKRILTYIKMSFNNDKLNGIDYIIKLTSLHIICDFSKYLLEYPDNVKEIIKNNALLNPNAKKLHNIKRINNISKITRENFNFIFQKNNKLNLSHIHPNILSYFLINTDNVITFDTVKTSIDNGYIVTSDLLMDIVFRSKYLDTSIIEILIESYYIKNNTLPQYLMNNCNLQNNKHKYILNIINNLINY